jgi:hypothetical protein
MTSPRGIGSVRPDKRKKGVADSWIGTIITYPLSPTLSLREKVGERGYSYF